MSRLAVSLLVSVVAVAAFLVLHVGTGRLALPPADVLAALTGNPTSEVHHQVVNGLRLPRALVAVASGGMLALAGALLQTVTRNDLAEPSLLGVTGGAVLAIVAVLAVTGTAPPPGTRPLVAIAGAAAGLVAVLFVAGTRSATRLVLTGAVLSAALSAATSVLLLRDGALLGPVLRWVVGSLQGRTWDDWAVLWPWAALTVVAAILCRRPLTALWVGPDAAQIVGVRVTLAAGAVLAVAASAAAAAAASVGAVAFVGLVAPHLARLVVGSHPARLVPLATALGAVLLLAADTLAEVATVTVPAGGIGSRAALPVGAVTALLGGPLLAALVAARRRSPR